MILEQVRDEMNQVNWVLDQFESVPGRFRNRAKRKELLRRAVLASTRGVGALIEDRAEGDPWRGDYDVYRALETMRQDRALLRAFVTAECRLLLDLGVDASAVEKMRSSLQDVLFTLEGEPDPAATEERLRALLEVLEQDLQRLEEEIDDEEVRQRLIGVLEALGGGLIVGADTAVGIGAIPVTFGLSPVGAAVSVAAGTEMLSRGVDSALA